MSSQTCVNVSSQRTDEVFGVLHNQLKPERVPSYTSGSLNKVLGGKTWLELLS